MKQLTILLLSSVVMCFAADDAAQPKKLELSDKDALTLRTQQVNVSNAQEAYRKYLDLPEISKARNEMADAQKILQATAKEIATHTCGEGGQIQEMKTGNGSETKLFCVAPPDKAPAPLAPAPVKATSPAKETTPEKK